MQAATQSNYSQISNPYLSLQGNLNTVFGGGAQSQLAQDARSLSNMLSGFSKTSFSVFSQTAGNGQSSIFIAQGSISSRGQPATQQPPSAGRNDNLGGQTNSTGGNRCNDNSRADNCTPPRNDCGSKDSGKSGQTPPRNDCGSKDSGKSGQTQWSDTAVCNNKASIDLGNYKLDFNKADSSMVMTNTKSGDTTKIFGDPHLTQHANSANSSTAMFNGPMTFVLPDKTKVTIGTQTAANNKNVSFADQVTITHRKQAYQVTGLSEQNQAGLSVQKSNNGRALDAAAPDGYTVTAARGGAGWIDPTTGKEPTPDNIKKANT